MGILVANLLLLVASFAQQTGVEVGDQIQPAHRIKHAVTSVDSSIISAHYSGRPTTYSAVTFGAVLDGVTDDTLAIQAALSAVPPTGGRVTIPGPTVVTTSLHPKSNTVVECNGFGSSISIPARGWNMSSTEIYGIINLKNVSNVRITGCHLIGNGPSGSDPEHAPKLVYLENVNNIQIDHNELEQSGCEGIWEGGTQTTNTNVDVGENYIHEMSLNSACGALPAIQMNADYAIVHDNRLRNVGTGIGFSAGHGSVIGNIVQNASLIAISTGDSGLNGPISIVGNTVDISANGATGFRIESGVPGPGYTDTSVQVTGNGCLAHGGRSAQQTCFWVTTARSVSVSSNFATVNSKGTGFSYFSTKGSTTTVMSIGNTCQGQSETAAIYCFAANSNGGTLTINQVGDYAFGVTRANSSYAFYIQNDPTVNYVGVVAAQGYFAAAPHRNASGEADGKPFTGQSPTNNGPQLSNQSAGLGTIQYFARASEGFNNNGEVACLSGDNAVQHCATSATNVIGIAIGPTTTPIAVQTSGYATVRYDGTYSPVAGWYACTSATVAGHVTPQTAACAAGRQVGIITAGGSNVSLGSVLLQFR